MLELEYGPFVRIVCSEIIVPFYPSFGEEVCATTEIYIFSMKIKLCKNPIHDIICGHKLLLVNVVGKKN